MTEPLKAPFPYFGGKSVVAADIWARLGNTPNYVEPFFGSGAVLLSRPTNHRWWEQTETINDLDGFVSNFWRSIKTAPEAVAKWADWPVNENDLHARHAWLVQRKDSLRASLEGDPDWCDPKIAGWWLWGICLWIGSGWCSGNGPWQVVEGKLVHLGGGMGINRQLVHLGDDGRGINRKRVHLGDDGRGINRKLVHLGDDGRGINRKRVHLGDGMGINRKLVHLGDGMGINRKLVHLGDDGRGLCEAWAEHLQATMQHLSDRLRRVRVCCGDWSRVCGPTPTEHLGLTGVFLDPPYDRSIRSSDLYTTESDVSQAVQEWALERGDNPLYRIALCGYDGERTMPSTWRCFEWKARGGYGSKGKGKGATMRTRNASGSAPIACGQKNSLRCSRQPRGKEVPAVKGGKKPGKK